MTFNFCRNLRTILSAAESPSLLHRSARRRRSPPKQRPRPIPIVFGVGTDPVELVLSQASIAQAEILLAFAL
jgi:hypothetical protein